MVMPKAGRTGNWILRNAKGMLLSDGVMAMRLISAVRPTWLPLTTRHVSTWVPSCSTAKRVPLASPKAWLTLRSSITTAPTSSEHEAVRGSSAQAQAIAVFFAGLEAVGGVMLDIIRAPVCTCLQTGWLCFSFASLKRHRNIQNRILSELTE